MSSVKSRLSLCIPVFSLSNIRDIFTYPLILVNDVGGLYWAHSEPLLENKNIYLFSHNNSSFDAGPRISSCSWSHKFILLG